MLAGVQHAPGTRAMCKEHASDDLNGRLLAVLLRGKETGGHPAAVEVTETRGTARPATSTTASTGCSGSLTENPRSRSSAAAPPRPAP